METLREALATLPDPVHADLLESDAAYRLVLDLPGVRSDGLSVTATDRALTIEGRREKSVPEGFEYHTDDRSLLLEATIPMPPDADPAAASASLEAGVLTIDVPRADRAGRSIEIEG